MALTIKAIGIEVKVYCQIKQFDKRSSIREETETWDRIVKLYICSDIS